MGCCGARSRARGAAKTQSGTSSLKLPCWPPVPRTRFPHVRGRPKSKYLVKPQSPYGHSTTHTCAHKKLLQLQHTHTRVHNAHTHATECAHTQHTHTAHTHARTHTRTHTRARGRTRAFWLRFPFRSSGCARTRRENKSASTSVGKRGKPPLGCALRPAPPRFLTSCAGRKVSVECRKARCRGEFRGREPPRRTTVKKNAASRTAAGRRKARARAFDRRFRRARDAAA